MRLLLYLCSLATFCYVTVLINILRVIRVRQLEHETGTDRMSSEERKRRLVQRHSEQENGYLRLRRARLCANDFRIIRVIGRGAYGEVCLVQKKDNAKIYAMKTLQKLKMVENDLPHVKSERDVMADCDSPWIVNLYYSFQDATKLYLIMEFLPGGDMMTMLIKYEIFPEDVTRFYIAQIVLAIEAVHSMGFIHRYGEFPDYIPGHSNYYPK